MEKTRRTAYLGVMVALSLILSILEGFIPIPISIPGIKIGLANIITLIIIIMFDTKSALTLTIIRCILMAVFTGGPIVFLLSITGGILSTLVMSFTYYKLKTIFSLVGVSILGAISHNIGQIAAASFIIKETATFAYMPILLISGIIMGTIIGMLTSKIVTTLKTHGLF